MSNRTNSSVSAASEAYAEKEGRVSRAMTRVVEAEESTRDVIDPPHPAAEYFSQQVRDLAATKVVKLRDTPDGKTRKLTPLMIQKILKEQAPDLPVSQTQMYRYFHGQAVPRLDVIIELARLFQVPVTYFVPQGVPPLSEDS